MPSQTYFELLEMMEAEAGPLRSGTRHTCPICRLSLAAVRRYLDLLSLENVNDIPTRLALRASNGFCSRHTYQWAELHDALATAIIYEDLLRETGKRIERGEFTARRGGFFGRNQAAPDGLFTVCPLCIQQEEVESRVSEEFAEGFETQERFRQAYAAPAVAGLCLGHFRRVVSQFEPRLAEEFGTEQRRKLAATQARLRQIIDKMDASINREHLTEEERAAAREIGEERESLVRALWQIVGLPNIK